MCAKANPLNAAVEKYKIKPLVITELEGPKPGMTYLSGFGETCISNGYIWFIQGPAKNIIVDTGGRAETLSMLGFPAKDLQTPKDALNKLGLGCGDIDIVIQTHLMFDHFELAGKFTKAKFVVQKDELDYARNPHPLMQFFYMPIQDLLSQVNFDIVEGEKEVVRGVRVFPTPGHSPGSQSVAIETEKGTAVITGFCCINENFKEGIFQVTPPGIHVNATQAYDSMLKVKEVANILVPLHEPTFTQKETIP